MIVRLTIDIAGLILTAAGLGFLGLGAQPPAPEWGALISTLRQYVLDHWWDSTMPGLAIVMVSLGFYLMGYDLKNGPQRPSRAGSVGCRASISAAHS